MLRQLRTAIMSVLAMAILFGLVFPLVITAIAQAAFHHQANGSLIERNGRVIGSELIGQSFSAPGYFHPRPSAAGNGYDASNSGGTNLGPTNAKLISDIKSLTAAYRKENGLPPNAPVPADAVTRSASGLDPDISPANARAQASRVAKARRTTVNEVERIIEANTSGRQLGALGEPRVNVLKLNLALDAHQ
jgi:potassium-transporting ATPase KdpC subunit